MTVVAEFTIPGLPVAKERPRATTIGGHARLYTPSKTRHYEADVRTFAARAMAGRPPVHAALVLDVLLHLPVPTSWSKKRQAAALAGAIVPTKKPDSSNVLKAIEDGMNGIVYVDDAAVVDHWVSKRYAAAPAALVRVSVLAGAEVAP